MRNGPGAGTSDGPVVEEFSATWTPGSTDLTGTCFCGARHQDPDPVAMWDWLDAHPEGHHATPTATGAPHAAEADGKSRQEGP
ncbi:hypothetical protein [Plantactinospora endophytica]|uniref:Uncharacterized protein n=1 Tax=Plantactinospora endophytica TaxID=673535 RepID=A0ABQ4DX35_9ACTN|nr:hypothetical protein [Plantactinospora endophytica]GIG86996.1 hypothetical protein Pen02_19320 [Plantactinospora endophytica]